MCLVALALHRHPRFPAVLASNRDEWFHRPSAPMDWWRPADGATPVLAGRDLAAGGTWLAFTAEGRVALVTNVREPGHEVPGAPSRGALPLHWLADPVDDLAPLAAVPRQGFNLLAADLRQGRGTWLTNRPRARQAALGAGVHAVSNADLDAPWPKVIALKARLARAVDEAGETADAGEALAQSLFDALRDDRTAPDADLPRTGVPTGRERALSAAFIRIDAGDAGLYGTVASTVAWVERVGADARLQVIERRYAPTGATADERRFTLALPR